MRVQQPKTIESKIWSAFPEVGEPGRQALVCMLHPNKCEQFNSGRPTGPLKFFLFRMAEIEFKQKSNWIRSNKDDCGLLDCEWGLIWFPDQFTTLRSIFIVKLSFHHIFQGTQIFSFQFMVCHWTHTAKNVSKTTKSYQAPAWLSGDGENMFLSRARGDFSSLHNKFFRIPALAFDFFQISWIASPVVA